jgi:hypothetical protein
MKKVTTLIFFVAALAFIGCEKEPSCTTGTVRFTSTSINPYSLYIDGDYQRQIPGNTFVEYELTEGTHQVKVEQVSGYLVFPTIKEGTLNVFGCKESEWIFP